MSEAILDDVIQIDPGSTNRAFAGCFALVKERRGWGVVVDVLVPAAEGVVLAPVRVAKDDFKIIGQAPWPNAGPRVEANA